MSRTNHWLLSKLEQGGSLSEDDYKILGADRDLLDLLLWVYGPNHHHTGSTVAITAPSSPLSLVLNSTAGSLPAGTRIFYKYTLVDANGQESTASPEAYVDTPAAVVEPGGPTLSTTPTGGTLLPGAYNYVLSAYKTVNTLETRAINFAALQVGGTTSTNKITLTLPTKPSGASGFNVYRRKPGGLGYQWIAAVDMTVATPPTTFVDTGLADDCARGLPNTNRTSSQNNVKITLPGATPAVPVGYTWRIYRSYVTGSYHNSLLHWVVEETAEGSGVRTPTYTDMGYATTLGDPPTAIPVITMPQKVQFTDAAEIQGTAPPKNIVFQRAVEFSQPGAISVKVGTFAWRCPYEKAYIEYVIISLGKNSIASGSNVLVDVNKWDSTLATPSWGTIFTDQALRPKILVGARDSAQTVPNIRSLVKGDKLTVDIDQVGGLATPTDNDLLITILMWYSNSTATTIVIP